MADIFVSYAREDSALVATLAAYLQESGWTVWWDRRILAGKHFDEIIETEIQAARSVVVVWTAHSVKSRWVKVEAGEAQRREILVPVVLDDCSPPLAFRNMQSVTLRDPIDPKSPEFNDFLEAITELIGQGTPRVPMTDAASPQAQTVADLPPPIRTDAVGSAASLAAPSEAPHRLATVPRKRYGVAAAVATALVTALVIGYQVFSNARSPGTSSELTGSTAPASSSPAGESTAQSTPTVSSPGDATRSTPDTPANPTSTDSAITPEAIRDFVGAYLSAANSADLDGLVRFYGDEVDYYDKGRVGHDYIRRDKRYYFNRWPIVSQTLEGDVSVTDGSTADTKVANFSSRYAVESPARNARATGKMGTTFVLMRAGDRLIIVSQRETVKSDRQ